MQIRTTITCEVTSFRMGKAGEHNGDNCNGITIKKKNQKKFEKRLQNTYVNINIYVYMYTHTHI